MEHSNFALSSNNLHVQLLCTGFSAASACYLTGWCQIGQVMSGAKAALYTVNVLSSPHWFWGSKPQLSVSAVQKALL